MHLYKKLLSNLTYLLKLSSIVLFISISNIGVASEITLIQEKGYAKSLLYNYGPIKVQVLKGSSLEMGIEYGANLKEELNQALGIIEDFYIVQHKVTYAQLKERAEQLYKRFPEEYKTFLTGVAVGSGLNLNDTKILNAMETYTGLINQEDVKCAFLFIPNSKTLTGAAMIGRNYDYPAPFDKLANLLTVTILKENGKIPTAFISIAGEAYCPSCVNSKGIFIELNNGTPSGGRSININTETMLSKMLETLQISKSLSEVNSNLNNVQSDYSLIVNAADSNNAYSFEFSSTLGMHSFIPNIGQTFASTNFYLNPIWGNSVPIPTDATTWNGVTRRNNLLNISSEMTPLNLNSLKHLMDLNISEGGAVWPLTIYQLILDESDLSLYIKINNQSLEWTQIPLKQLFNL